MFSESCVVSCVIKRALGMGSARPYGLFRLTGVELATGLDNRPDSNWNRKREATSSAMYLPACSKALFWSTRLNCRSDVTKNSDAPFDMWDHTTCFVLVSDTVTPTTTSVRLSSV